MEFALREYGISRNSLVRITCAPSEAYTNYSISIIRYRTSNFASLNSVENIFPIRLQYQQSGTYSTQNILWMQVHKPPKRKRGVFSCVGIFFFHVTGMNERLVCVLKFQLIPHITFTSRINLSQSHLLLSFQPYRDWCRRPAKLSYQILCDYSLK
jgi:hypothetical protein